MATESSIARQIYEAPFVGFCAAVVVRIRVGYQTPSIAVPVREGTSKGDADRLTLRLSRLSLSQLLHNKGGVTVRESIVKGDTVRAQFSCVEIVSLRQRATQFSQVFC